MLKRGRIEQLLGTMSIDIILHLDELAGILERKPENIFTLIARNNIVGILRIQVAQFFDGNAGEILDLLEMKHPVNMESVQMGSI